jgi:hypothetical protein
MVWDALAFATLGICCEGLVADVGIGAGVQTATILVDFIMLSFSLQYSTATQSWHRPPSPPVKWYP